MHDEKRRFTKRHWYGILFLMVVLGIMALSQGDADTTTNEIPVSPVHAIDPEFASMFDPQGEPLPVIQRMYSGMLNGTFVSDLQVPVVVNEGLTIYQGDILLAMNRPTLAGLGVQQETFLWDNDLVPYQIDARLTDQARVTDAIAHWEANTSMRFVLRTEGNASQYPNYVLFRPGQGCSSYVGMQGGMQPITLAPACSTGSTIHEIGHAVGLWHEQSRHDRDSHVEIRYQNIIPMYAYNFDKQTQNGVDIGAYDFNSIMHYPRWAFSRNGEDTIVPLGGQEIGQRDKLSSGDIGAVRDMYGD